MKELVRIMECMKTMKQIVVPVFYELDRCDIKSSFEEGFGKHDVEEVRRLKSLLIQAASLSCWDSRNYR